MAGAPTGDRDVATVVAVDAFGAAGVVVGLFDFFLVQRRPILQLDPLGVVVFLLGLTLVAAAVRALGRSFSLRIEAAGEQRLVQSGPYRFIRHPLYLGLILAFFSGPITWQSAYGALVMLPIIPLLLLRIRHEERVMALIFDGYAAYARGTKRLIPLIY